jgi:hypothetical protein
MNRTLIVLTVVVILLTGWTYYMLWILAALWATSIVWWASLPVLAAGPVAILTSVLSWRRRAWALVAVNGLLAGAHVALLTWLIAGSMQPRRVQRQTYELGRPIEAGRDSTVSPR